MGGREREIALITVRGFLVAVVGLLPAFALAGLFVGLGEMLGLPEVLLGCGCFLILFGVPPATYYLVEKAHERKCEEVLRAEGFARVEKADDDLRRELEVFPGAAAVFGRGSADAGRILQEVFSDGFRSATGS